VFGGIGFGAERLGLAALRFPRTAWIGAIVLLALIAVSLPRLSFDNDIHRAFLSDSPLSQAQRAYDASQSPPLGTVLIHITSPVALTAAQMARLRDLSLDLEFVGGVTAVASPFVLRTPPTPDAPSGTPLFGPQIDANFNAALMSFDALNTGLPIFVNETLTAMLFSVSVDTNQSTVAEIVPTISAALNQGLPAGLSAHITGEDVISSEIVTGLKDDLIALNLWGALIVMLAAAALLRDLTVAFLAVGPALVGAAAVLALSVWLGYPITVLSNVIPILLLVLGVADGVHLANGLKDSGNVHAAIQTVGPACALTALTTAVAFASITLTGNSQLFEFAILGAVGTMLSFAIVIVLFALLGRTLRLSDRPLPPISAAIAQRLTALGAARPRVTIAGCILLLIVATIGFSQTRAWFPLYQNLPDNSPTLATNDAISADFGGVFQMIVESDGDWETTRALARALEAASGPRTVLSDLNLARWLGRPDVRPSPADMAMLPKAIVDQLRAENGTSRLFVSVPEPMRNKDTLAQFDRVYDAALTAGADRIIGLPTIMRHEAVDLIGQLSLGLLVATLGATAMAAAAFRSVAIVPVLIIPNVLPLMLTGASLHLWAEGQLTPTAVLALTIAFGIAIDDTVHFLSRFRAAQLRGATARQAVSAASLAAGQVMVLTTLLLTCGLCVTLFSDFSPIRVFGGMMIVTLWAALLIDLLLLPALLTWKGAAHGTV